MNRRSFMKGILAACAAPYVVTSAGVLMPVRALAVPATTTLVAAALWSVGDRITIGEEVFVVTEVSGLTQCTVRRALPSDDHPLVDGILLGGRDCWRFAP